MVFNKIAKLCVRFWIEWIDRVIRFFQFQLISFKTFVVDGA